MPLTSNENMGPSGGVIITIKTTGTQLLPTSVPQILFIATELQKWRVREIRTILTSASTSGTLQLEVLTGTQAMGTGTIITPVISLSGALNTVQQTLATGYVVMNPGDRVATRFAGTLTNLAGLSQITLHRHRT